MEINIALIRSASTAYNEGNLLQGKTNEPVSEQGRAFVEKKLAQKAYPDATRVYTSPEKRCLETAAIIYRYIPATVAFGFEAFEYGKFECKSTRQLKKDREFADWLADNDNALTLNNQDENLYFAKINNQFNEIIKECSNETENNFIAIITHNIVIKSIIKQVCIPRFLYAQTPLTCGLGVVLRYNCYNKNAVIAKFLK